MAGSMHVLSTYVSLVPPCSHIPHPPLFILKLGQDSVKGKDMTISEFLNVSKAVEATSGLVLEAQKLMNNGSAVHTFKLGWLWSESES